MSTMQAPTTAPPVTKTCPTCGREIKNAAVVCRYCGHEFHETPAKPARARPGRAKTAAGPAPSLLERGLLNLHSLAALGIVVLGIAGLTADISSPRWRFAATWEDAYAVHYWRIGVATLIVPLVCLVLANVRGWVRNGLAAALWIVGAVATAVLYVNWRNDATAPVVVQWTGYAIAATFCVGVLATLGLFLATLRGGRREGRNP